MAPENSAKENDIQVFDEVHNIFCFIVRVSSFSVSQSRGEPTDGFGLCSRWRADYSIIVIDHLLDCLIHAHEIPPILYESDGASHRTRSPRRSKGNIKDVLSLGQSLRFGSFFSFCLDGKSIIVAPMELIAEQR